ncbi:hypothetical protein M2336_003632 [Sphingobium sp. B1D7B]|uniref:hypothetical protein n=1 Tax=Sphingobium sp. B1D7B TaxID=2940578 RepID=UPI002224E705|nr:hypothetical protein [Sphingobium sp. B1D7B]MCW2406948.1 hypothetical protein [Sphingobium sp. B1D7B]
MKMNALRLAAIGAVAIVAMPAANAQDSQRVTELYHIFDFKTDAKRAPMIKALQDGLNPNISNSDTTTPLVMGPPPEKPGRFRLVNPFENIPFAGMVSSAQMASVKQARCDGAVWISSAVRKVRGSQQLMMTMCLFPYVEGYQLNVYAVDIKEQGGGLSARLGRALGQAVVGKPDDWTNKTILDVVRRVRTDTGATVTYVEGQPEFVGTPWEDGPRITPGEGDKTVDPN